MGIKGALCALESSCDGEGELGVRKGCERARMKWRGWLVSFHLQELLVLHTAAVAQAGERLRRATERRAIGVEPSEARDAPFAPKLGAGLRKVSTRGRHLQPNF